jgi:hypothetical protein
MSTMVISEVHLAPGIELALEYRDQAHGYHAFVAIARRYVARP